MWSRRTMKMNSGIIVVVNRADAERAFALIQGLGLRWGKMYHGLTKTRMQIPVNAGYVDEYGIGVAETLADECIACEVIGM